MLSLYVKDNDLIQAVSLLCLLVKDHCSEEKEDFVVVETPLKSVPSFELLFSRVDLGHDNIPNASLGALDGQLGHPVHGLLTDSPVKQELLVLLAAVANETVALACLGNPRAVDVLVHFEVEPHFVFHVVVHFLLDVQELLERVFVDLNVDGRRVHHVAGGCRPVSLPLFLMWRKQPQSVFLRLVLVGD
jgi:hypothetical protein